MSDLPSPSESAQLLGISNEQLNDDEAIHSAWKRLAMKWHPDRAGGDKEVFQKLTNARDVLIDRGGLDIGAAKSASTAGGAYRCPRCQAPVIAPVKNGVPALLFRCPTCSAILRNPDPAARRSNVHDARPEDFVERHTATQLGLRHFPGAVRLTRDIDTSKIQVVWRCKMCEPTNSVCCRVKPRKGECLCGHKLADHIGGARRGPTSTKGKPFSCTKCPCTRFQYHVRIGGWQVRCQCKHKHTDHDPVTHRCRKTKPGSGGAPCPCSHFEARWVCNCGHR